MREEAAATASALLGEMLASAPAAEVNWARAELSVASCSMREVKAGSAVKDSRYAPSALAYAVT